MSFTTDIKNELCKIQTSTCCKISECYGMLLFGRTFSADSMSVSTENEDVVDRLTLLLRQCYSVRPTITGGGNQRDFFTVSVPERAAREDILNALGYFGFRDGDAIIKRQNIEEDCCQSSFLRGAFLVCGMVSDPNKEYHAEFSVHRAGLGEELFYLLKERGLSPGITARGKNSVVYFKEGDHIEDLLTTVQATNHTLELAGIRVYKDMRNHYNRLNNCETANISKTVNAAVTQNRAIAKLMQAGALSGLSEELRQAADLRRENPEASLKELCEAAGGTVTKSGLNHRLNRLVQLAGRLE